MSCSASEGLRVVYVRLVGSRPKLTHEEDPLSSVGIDVGSSFNHRHDVVGPGRVFE
jgi:hypothetical protein